MKKTFIASLIFTFIFTAFASFALAESTSTATTTPDKKKTIDVNCINAAIEKRDNAIMVVWNNYATTTKKNLETRRDGLKSAWSQNTEKRVRLKALLKVWKDYAMAQFKAKRDLMTGKRNIWKQYNTERKSCGVQANMDGAHEGMDWQL